MWRPKKVWIECLCAVLVMVPAWWVFGGQTADPVKSWLLGTGETALQILLICLVIRPLAYFVKTPWLLPARRVFGVGAALWMMGHFVLWLIAYLRLDLQRLVGEIVERPFITVGALALLLSLPLLLTSTQWARRRLGRRWVMLHRTVYAVMGFSILHYAWQLRGNAFEIGAYILAGATLIVVRVVIWRQRRQPT